MVNLFQHYQGHQDNNLDVVIEEMNTVIEEVPQIKVLDIAENIEEFVFGIPEGVNVGEDSGRHLRVWNTPRKHKDYTGGEKLERYWV